MRCFQINALIFLLALCLLNGSGCRLWNKRAKPPAETGRPALPEAIERDGEEEPIIRVYMHETGMVEEKAFDDYIAGVVAAEMDPGWPFEALAAQAIIARSFTLQKIAEDGGVPEREAHASTDIEEFQAYDADRITERVREAVKSSRGRVAVYKGEFIRGWFHAYAGPRTALADEGLEFEGGNPPYIQIVESPAQNIIPAEEANWQAAFPLEEVQAAVADTSGTDPGPVEKVKITAKGPSGRATRITVNDLEVPAPSLRLSLGSTAMRSTFIESLAVENGYLKLAGTGYGHGVGMCQWGARALAEEGKNCEDIVRYFYRDIEIVTVW